MELYLDSANLAEIKTAFELGFLKGLTTTPTFMHREGISDLDSTIKELAQLVPILQIEALGRDEQTIIDEANRLLDLGLDKSRTVFKIPVSVAGVKACNKMVQEGMMINIHLVYTVQQAYMAIAAGATYVCPLVGRLQDQGHDALTIVAECVNIVDHYNYDSKIMFSSVRNIEHVKNALQIGVHACTVPWKLLKSLTDNYFTTIGTKEFFEHTNLITIDVASAVSQRPWVNVNKKIIDGLLEMTKSKLGAVVVLDDKENIVGIFTDGDLRRAIEKSGSGVINQTFSDLALKSPLTIDASYRLDDAWQLFKDKQIDTLVVVKDGRYLGLLDVQDLLKIISGDKKLS